MIQTYTTERESESVRQRLKSVGCLHCQHGLMVLLFFIFYFLVFGLYWVLPKEIGLELFLFLSIWVAFVLGICLKSTCMPFYLCFYFFYFFLLVFISFLLPMFLFLMFSLFVFVKLFECFLLKKLKSNLIFSLQLRYIGYSVHRLQ